MAFTNETKNIQKIFINNTQVSQEEFDRMTGENRHEALRKELEVFVTLLNTRPDLMLRDTCVYNGTRNENGFDKNRLTQFLFNHNHVIGGEVGQGSHGFLGSRWADAPVGRHGETRRLAFYSRKHNPEWLKPFPGKSFLVYIME